MPKIDENSPLTNKQAAFVDYYMQYFDATKAAIKAGYAKGFASRQGSRMLKQVNIRKVLQEKQEELAANLGMSRQMQMDKLNDLYQKRSLAKADQMKLKIIEIQNKMLGFDTPKLQNERDKYKIVEIPVPMETYKGAREIEV